MIKALKTILQLSFPLFWRWICPMMEGMIREFYLYFILLVYMYIYIYTSHFPRFRRSPCKSQGDHTKIPKDTVCFSPKPTAEKHWDHSSVRSSALPAIAQLHKAQSLDLFRRNKLIHNTCSKSTWICYKLQHLEDDVQHFSLSNVPVSKGQKHRHRHCEAIPAPKSRAWTFFGEPWLYGRKKIFLQQMDRYMYIYAYDTYDKYSIIDCIYQYIIQWANIYHVCGSIFVRSHLK